MKIVVMALIILVLAALVTYTNSNLTGETVVLNQIKGTKAYSETQIILNPTEAKRGENINITVIPGSGGAGTKMNVYLSGARKDSTSEWCNLGWTREQILQGAESFKCTMERTFSYRIPSFFAPGDYSIRIRDYAKDEENQCKNLHGESQDLCLSSVAWFRVTK